MRIGIWCDYGFTLEPSEGIGVFVDCLARGLVRADSACEVVLAAHPGQSSVLESTVAAGAGRISVARRLQPSRVRRRALRTLSKLGARIPPPQKPLQPKTGTLLANRAHSSFTAKGLDQLATVLARPYSADTQRLIDTCDLWLLPYVGLDQHFSKPAVVVVHDLVCYHFADVMKPSRLKRFQQQVDQQTASASVVACMSDFIKSNDLCGVLKLAADRVRVIRSAVPDHLPPTPSAASYAAAQQIPQMEFAEPYLLYPSAFRTYKNHRYLVELIPRLKTSGLWPMKVVFTGIRQCPGWLQEVIDANAAQDSVVMLGKVTREQLSVLYRRAFATVVPSLYEQGSFPLLEALHHGCPALAADIPSLREQFSAMGDAMVYFDPSAGGSVIEPLRRIAADRQHFVEGQQASFQRLRARTWTHAAADWLDVFRSLVDTQPSCGDRAA